MKSYPYKANHADEQPCRIICYDTETWQDECPNEPDRVIHRWRMGCGKLLTRKGEHWKQHDTQVFWDRGQMMDWIMAQCRPREPLWVYAHNAAFDASILGLWETLDCGTQWVSQAGKQYICPRTGELKTARDWHGTLAVDNLPFIVETRCAGGMIKWVDTLNYIPCRLEKLGEWCKLSKMIMPSESASDEDWEDYCRNDVLILATAVLRLLGLWRGRRLGNWQPTVAKLAFSCFRHIVPKSGIVAHGDDDHDPDTLATYWIAGVNPPPSALDISRLERRAYYGARTWVGYIGDIGADGAFTSDMRDWTNGAKRPRIDGPLSVLDVNGLYAYVMRTERFPIKLMDARFNPDINVFTNCVFHYPCVADVFLNSPDYAYPVREDKRTYYRRGRFATSLCGPELKQACEMGHVVRCDMIATYYSGQPFVDYVDYWWQLRLDAIADGDECTAKLAKNMINSLYGKLAQRRPSWQRVEDVKTEQRWGGFIHDRGDGNGFQRFRAVAGEIQQLVDRVDCQHTFTALAAYVTSYGRYYLESLRRMLPHRSVVYQDTDSLFCLPAAVSALEKLNMLDRVGIGKLKVEGMFSKASIYGAKNYDKEEQPTVAGLRAIREEAGFRRWYQWYFERCNGIVARKPDGSVHMWRQLFSAPGSATGYSVHSDGWTVPTRRG